MSNGCLKMACKSAAAVPGYKISIVCIDNLFKNAMESTGTCYIVLQMSHDYAAAEPMRIPSKYLHGILSLISQSRIIASTQ